MPRNSPEIERCRNALKEQLKLAQNKRCADCGVKQPTWASTNIGVFVCIRCSGIHRNLGTHISKVKSTTLDSWTYKLLDHFTKQGGNKAVNARYEAKFPKSIKPTESTDTYTLEQFIRAKYCHKKYYAQVKVKINNGNSNNSSSDESNSDIKITNNNNKRIRNGKNGKTKLNKPTKMNGAKKDKISKQRQSRQNGATKSESSSNNVSNSSKKSSKPSPNVPDLLDSSQLDYLSGTVGNGKSNGDNVLLKFMGGDRNKEASKSSILSRFNSNNGNNSNSNNNNSNKGITQSPFAHILNQQNDNSSSWIGLGNNNSIDNNSKNNENNQIDLIDINENDNDRAKNSILSKFKDSNNNTNLFGLQSNNKSKAHVPNDFMTQLGVPAQTKVNNNRVNTMNTMNGMNNVYGMNTVQNMASFNNVNNNMNVNMSVSMSMNGSLMDSPSKVTINKSNVSRNLADLYKKPANSSNMPVRNPNVFTMLNGV